MKIVEVVAAVIQKDNKIFCAQRNLSKYMGGKWEFPGGKIEVGETREEALVREIKEELDSDIVVDKYLMTVEHDYPTFHITMHAYLCRLVKGVLTLKEHDDSVWLNKEELLSLDWAAADKPIVENIINNCY